MADINFYSAINLNGLELKNFRAHNVAQASATAALGALICDSNVLKYYASGWHTLAKVTDINLDNLGIGSVTGGAGFLKRSSGGAWSFDNTTYQTSIADVTDSVNGYVSKVTQTNGKIAVTHASFTKPVVAWTAGTTAGPTLKVTTDGGASDAVAIPSASASASGIVTTGAQTFAGTKTFNSTITGSISGNAGTATKLATARNLWGNSFDGSAAVNGPLTFNVGSSASTTAHLEVITVNGKTYLHTRLPFYSDDSVSAGGIGTSGGGGTGTVTGVKLGSTTYEPASGSTLIELPFVTAASGITAGSTSLASAGAIKGYVDSAVGGLSSSSLTIQANGTSKGTYNPTSGTATTINITASDLGLSAALRFEGVTTTAISDGSTTNPVTIDGHSVTAVKGSVVLYNSKEFVWTGSAWEELGDESSFALKTRTISGGKASGHTYGLAGGGTLEANRTITLDATTNTAIGQGVTAYGWGNHASAGYLTASSAKGTYTGTKRYTIASGSTTFTPSSYEFADNNIVAAIYDGSNNVVLSDMKVVTSSSKYTMQVSFAAATSAALYLVIIGKLA